ncbi:MAG: 30S ribosomal protein S19e [Candidatus Bathyarchaeia archaeon]
MATPYEVPADKLIEMLSKHLAENVEAVNPPQWAAYVKTGAHAQRPPDADDWWYTRCASLLRKLYIHGPIGVSRLRLEYGGRRTGRASRPERFRRGGGAILRRALQQLELAGLVKTSKRGRSLTTEGKSLLEQVAGKIKIEMEKIMQAGG